MDARLVTVGKFGRPHGLRGEVRAQLYNPLSTSVDVGVSIVVPNLPAPNRFVVMGARPFKQMMLLMMEGIDTRERADSLKQLEFCVHESVLPELESDEFFVRDLIGLAAVSPGGDGLGTVRDVETAAHHDTMMIADHQGVFLVPFVDEFVTRIDLDRREVELSLPDGLRSATLIASEDDE